VAGAVDSRFGSISPAAAPGSAFLSGCRVAVRDLKCGRCAYVVCRMVRENG